MKPIAKLRLRIVAFQIAYVALFFVLGQSIVSALGLAALFTFFVAGFIGIARYDHGYYMPAGVAIMSADDPEMNTWIEALGAIFLLFLISAFITKAYLN